MNTKAQLGSETAKGGFANEKDICNKFNDWKNDTEANIWLKIMGYDTDKLNSVVAIQVPTKIKKSDLQKFDVTESDYNEFVRFKKADAQIRIIITIGGILKIETLSLKKANANAGFNQIDKRTVDSYQTMWGFDDEITHWLKLFTGAIIPSTELKSRDNRRLFLDEMPIEIQNKILDFFSRNKILIISDILKDRGGLSANWMLVTKLNQAENTTTWILKDINSVMNFYGQGNVTISPRGSFNIGKIGVQRKGGTPDPTKLQFKFDPNNLFNPN